MNKPFDYETLLTAGVATPTFPATLHTYPTFGNGAGQAVDLVLLRGQQSLLGQVIAQLAAAGLDPQLVEHLDALHDTVGYLLDPYHAVAEKFDDAVENDDREAWLPQLRNLGITLNPS